MWEDSKKAPAKKQKQKINTRNMVNKQETFNY